MFDVTAPHYPMRCRLLALAALLACDGGADGDGTRTDSIAAEPLTAASASVPAVDSAAPKLPPIDQADSSFRAFRDDLLRALAQRDTVFLYGILSPTIRNSFGPDDGVAGFRNMWQPAEPGSPVWAALSRVLRLGGRLEDGSFVAPYVAAFWPQSVDPFQYIAVTSERAIVYASPARDASVIGTASYSLLRAQEWTGMGESFVATDTSWVRVQFLGGKQGWLNATDVHGPTAWRAFFERQDGRWLLVAFVAGD